MAANLKKLPGARISRAMLPAFVFVFAASTAWPQAAPAPAAGAPGATEIPRAAEFKKLAADMVYDRAHWRDTTHQSQEEALDILDPAVLNALNGSAAPDLSSLNSSLATLPEVGTSDQNYRVTQLGDGNPVYALVANFGPNGPSAVRIYALQNRSYELLGRIDRFSEPSYFDDYLILLPLKNFPGVFVTVTGRTDSLSTGMYGAWLFAGGRLKKLWLTELLVHSSYAPQADGLQLDYCGEPDDADPAICHQTLRDVYAWNGSAWKRTSQTVIPPAH